MSVLAGTLVLGEGFPGRIDDTESLVRKVVDDRLRQWGAKLKEVDYEECVSYLIGVCWELSGRYDPKKESNPARANFAAYASKILTLRVADWYRQRFGDTRHADKPIVLSLDGPALGGGDAEDQDRIGQLVDTLPASTGDPAHDRTPDLVGVLSGGSRPQGGPHDEVGEPPAGGAARGARMPARSPAGLKNGRVPGTYKKGPPICSACFESFFNGFLAADQARTDGKRRSEKDIALQAKGRARAVFVKEGDDSKKGVWVCPRHIRLEDASAHEAFMQRVYHEPKQQARKKKRRQKGRA